MMRPHLIATAIGITLFAVPGMAWAQGAAPVGDAAVRCARFTTPEGVAGIDRRGRLSVRSATFHPATTADGMTLALPAHCEIIGLLDTRRGSDGQPYAITFHLRLPQAWNHRFFFQGGGGSNGVIGDALGNLQGGQKVVALQRGFAVVSQDSGHDNRVNDQPDRGGILSFGLDDIARRNYAFASLGRVTDIAKALVAAYYGAPPAYSYFVGCSKGGQEGMAMAEHYPAAFDGIMANAPGFSLPRAAIAELWDSKAFLRLARQSGTRTPEGLPLMNRGFSDGDLLLVSQAVLSACDALDGAKDGIVGAVGQCTTARVRPALRALTCKAAKDGGCLHDDQIAALLTVMEGARDGKGLPVYADWPWDAGIGGLPGGANRGGWRAWKIGSAEGTRNDALNLRLGAASLAMVFQTPALPLATSEPALVAFEESADVDGLLAGIYRAAPGFAESAWDLMSARSADRGAFARAGGKMIVMHGAADPVFSLNDTLDWWRALDAAEGGQAARFTRVFPVPGMNHCGGGPGTTDFDAFTALVQWVEKGQAPEAILATAPAGTPWPGRTRPLCAYPAIARYKGEGSLEDAANFACAASEAGSKAS